MRGKALWLLLAVAAWFVLGPVSPAYAQENAPTPTPAPAETQKAIELYATYPEMIVGAGENATFEFTLKVTQSQLIRLSVRDLPEGWEYEFRGGIRTIRAVYARANDEMNLRLQVTPAKDAAAGDYTFYIVAEGEGGQKAEFPLTITIKEKQPPRITLKVDLPTLKGSPTTTFRFGLTVKNESDQDLTVSLQADAPPFLLTRFLSFGKEITSVPVEANSSKRVDLEVRSIVEIQAGEYPIKITAQGGDLKAETEVKVIITGQPDLKLSTPTNRLSGEATAGKATEFRFVIENRGSAPAHNVKFSADKPTGWEVVFEPRELAQLPAGQKQEIKVTIRPDAKAVAGDYMITLRATSEEGPRASVDYRVTVTTSTVWGLVGLGIIAVAVLVVGGAVMFYGRR